MKIGKGMTWRDGFHVTIEGAGKITIGTSPFYCHKYVGWDSDIFLAMGKFSKRGLIPYKDFFDHKGPFIIFIQWLGYLILVPTAIYFLKEHALREMLYATFTYNFKHGFERASLSEIEIVNMIVLVLQCGCLLLYLQWHW